MTKAEAADFLGVSQKTIYRMKERGEISASIVRGKTGDVLVFDPDELAAYKEQRDQPKLHVPSLIKAEAHPPAQSIILASQMALDNRTDTGSVADFAEAMRSQAEANKSLADSQRLLADAQLLTLLHHKATLNLQEAAQVSGLSITFLEKAVKAEKLKTLAGARGSKVIKKTDLDVFISKL